MKTIVHPVILCGGSGSRLWPLSTPKTPKQFLALTSNRSMIEETAARVDQSLRSDLEFAQLLVVGSKRHAKLLSEKLPDAKKILEPFGRNSAPAIAAACLTCDPDDLVLILPADHDIQDVAAFHEAIAIAAKTAKQDAIVTFGIEPTHQATGYGYIKTMGECDSRKALPVEQFVEKPDQTTAQAFLDAGGYFWNAGIFLFKASVMLDTLQKFSSEVLDGTRSAVLDPSAETIHLERAAFAATPSISIDYAVMEKAPNVETVPVKMGWSDVGGYEALHELVTVKREANHTHGRVILNNTKGSYVRSDGPTVTVNGVSDMVIIATESEVMITPMGEAGAARSLGKQALAMDQCFGIAPETIAQTRDWLWEAFDVWAKKGWDSKHGGFVEQLSMTGDPDLEADRRVRVQARQVFSFAKAIEMGWPSVDKAHALVKKGVDHIDTKLRHPEGGWVHVIQRDNTPVDERRDLYDHAFIILAGATAFRITGSKTGLKIADDAIAFIDAELKDHEHGGWFQGKPTSLPRSADPHMHLLEAMLAYHEATGCPKSLVRSAEIVRLFETRFFNPANDVMAEDFTNEWRLETSDDETVFQPGHHYEWASLLHEYERVTGHDSGSWRRRLIRLADSKGVNPTTGMPINAFRANGEIKNPNSRLWNALEMFRVYLLHPNEASIARKESLLNALKKAYLDRGPTGGWLDEIDADGEPVAELVPASMLYHTVTAFSSLARRLHGE